MGVNVNSTANVEEVFLEDETKANGKIDFDIGGQTRDYPLHITFCIDTSGSMSSGIGADGLVDTLTGSGDQSKMDVAKKGLNQAIDQLLSRDTFGVVSFNSSAQTQVQPTSGDSTSQAKSTVKRLNSGGGTDIKGALSSSRSLLKKMPNEDAVEWIVLISDGKGNVPSDRQLERRYSQEGIVIQAAGVGGGYDRQQMLNLAQRTQGELEDIDSARALREFFTEEVKNARNVIALDAELQIEPSDIISIDEVYYSLAEQTSTIDPEWRHGNCVINLGDVNRENPPQVVFDMDIQPNEVDLSAELAHVVLQTDEDRATDDITVVVDERLGIEPGEDGDSKKDEYARPEPTPDPTFILKKISTLAQDGKLDEARQYLEENKQHLSSEDYREAERLIDEGDVSGLGKL